MGPIFGAGGQAVFQAGQCRAFAAVAQVGDLDEPEAGARAGKAMEVVAKGFQSNTVGGPGFEPGQQDGHHVGAHPAASRIVGAKDGECVVFGVHGQILGGGREWVAT